jgi:AraC-like DNA-binding protein
MYDHHYVIKELAKQREMELRKVMRETNMTKKKSLSSYFPLFKQTLQYESH